MHTFEDFEIQQYGNEQMIFFSFLQICALCLSTLHHYTKKKILWILQLRNPPPKNV